MQCVFRWRLCADELNTSGKHKENGGSFPEQKCWRLLVCTNCFGFQINVYWSQARNIVLQLTQKLNVVGPASPCGELFLDNCSNLSNIDGLSQYAGDFSFTQYNQGTTGEVNLEEAFRDLLELAKVDSSTCKARVKTLILSGHSPGLAGVVQMELEDAQHVGLLISALCKAQPTHLQKLYICCKEGGDCGCDKNVPLFGSLPRPAHAAHLYPELRYCCSQVMRHVLMHVN